MVESSIFSDVSVSSLKSRVYNLLLDIIVDGKLKEGESLPPERVLCDELKVSRTVLREVIRALEARGLLTVVQGSGTKINPVDSWDMTQAFKIFSKRHNKDIALKDLYDLRFIVEPEIAGMAALDPSPENVNKLENIIEEMRVNKNDFKKLFNLDMEFHLQIAKMTNNIYFIAIIEGLVTPSRKCLSRIKEMDSERTLKEHEEIVEYIKNGDGKNAKKAMVKSLSYSKELFGKIIKI